MGGADYKYVFICARVKCHWHWQIRPWRFLQWHWQSTPYILYRWSDVLLETNWKCFTGQTCNVSCFIFLTVDTNVDNEAMAAYKRWFRADISWYSSSERRRYHVARNFTRNTWQIESTSGPNSFFLTKNRYLCLILLGFYLTFNFSVII